MKNLQDAIITGFLVVIIGLGGVILYNVSRDNVSETNTSQTLDHQETEEQHTHNVNISEDGRSVTYQGETGKTALEILESETTVGVEESAFGKFVTSIDGVSADSGSEFWAFYVNGELASEGAGTYQTSDGELIEWRLESLQ